MKNFASTTTLENNFSSIIVQLEIRKEEEFFRRKYILRISRWIGRFDT